MPLKLPPIIGHRGCAAYAPENTLVSLHSAADIGVEWVELDVKLTKDQVPILFHDDALERITGHSGNVADMRYAEIKDLDAGLWFGESFIGESIPTLEEAVDVLIERDLGLNLEIKPCPGREKETAEVALDILSQIWDDHDRLYLSSYSMTSLETAQDMAEDWARGLVLGYNCEENWLERLTQGQLPDALDDAVRYLDLKTISIDNDFCNQVNIARMIQMGVTPVPYNVNTAERAGELNSWGVTCVISDEPDIAQDGIAMVH